MKHIMVDIETFGTGNHSLIISLGAVWFDPNVLGAIKERFYVTIDPIQAQRNGFRVDMPTVMWWMQPEQRLAWDQWTKTMHFPPELALQGFSQWLDQLDQIEPPPPMPAREDGSPGINHRTFWANSPAFDCVILRQQYEVMMLPAPWGFRNEMDVRTFKNLPKAKSVCPPQVGLVHNSVDDAEHQARWVQAILGVYDMEV